MNGRGPFTETIRSSINTNPRRPPAALLRLREPHFSTHSPATSPPPSSKAFSRWSAKRLLSSIVMGAVLAGCAPSAKVLSVEDVSKSRASPPAVVYVADFELAPGSIQSETPLASRPFHAYREQSQARSLVATMRTSIVEDLAGKGIMAERLPPNSSLPKQGWLVRGVFMKVDEGDRARRAVIGFGSGQTDLEVAISTDDLSAETAPALLFRAQLDATSNKGPGAAITLNPYVAAAKFVLAGHDLDRSTQSIAEKIADEVAARVNGTAPKAQHKEAAQNSTCQLNRLGSLATCLLNLGPSQLTAADQKTVQEAQRSVNN
jgi:hypothetical protein